MLTICDLLESNRTESYDCPKKINPCKSYDLQGFEDF